MPNARFAVFRSSADDALGEVGGHGVEQAVDLALVAQVHRAEDRRAATSAGHSVGGSFFCAAGVARRVAALLQRGLLELRHPADHLGPGDVVRAHRHVDLARHAGLVLERRSRPPAPGGPAAPARARRRPPRSGCRRPSRRSPRPARRPAPGAAARPRRPALRSPRSDRADADPPPAPRPGLARRATPRSDRRPRAPVRARRGNSGGTSESAAVAAEAHQRGEPGGERARQGQHDAEHQQRAEAAHHRHRRQQQHEEAGRGREAGGGDRRAAGRGRHARAAARSSGSRGRVPRRGAPGTGSRSPRPARSAPGSTAIEAIVEPPARQRQRAVGHGGGGQRRAPAAAARRRLRNTSASVAAISSRAAPSSTKIALADLVGKPLDHHRHARDHVLAHRAGA